MRLEDQTGGLTGLGLSIRIVIARRRVRALARDGLHEQRQPTAKQKAHHESKMVFMKIQQDSGIPSGQAVSKASGWLGSLLGK